VGSTRGALQLVAVGFDDAGRKDDARRLIAEYLAWVAGVAAAQHGLHFDAKAMLASDIGDRGKFYAPSGRMYLLRDGEDAVGVGTLRRLDGEAAEIHRMYVSPAWRGRGASRLLLERLLGDARAMGCAEVRLRSLKSLTPAHALYRSAGFAEMPADGTDGLPGDQAEATQSASREGVMFMALRLRT
jgi:GNAT superfamily N-acetyltransferase